MDPVCMYNRLSTLVLLLLYTVLNAHGLDVKVPHKTVGQGGGVTVLKCRYHVTDKDSFQSLMWTGPRGIVFEIPHVNEHGNIYKNGSFLHDYKRRGSVMPYYRGQSMTDLLISLSEMNYEDEGVYNCTVNANSGSAASGATKLILDYSTSHSTVQCHRAEPFHLWCSTGTVQVYALQYGWNQNRHTCSFEPYGCTDGYRYPENSTHLKPHRNKCEERTACKINPKPIHLKCYGLPVLTSTVVAVRYWCADRTSKSITSCHDEGTIMLWCQSGTIVIYRIKYGMNQDATVCTEYEEGSCVESFTTPANNSHIDKYMSQCNGRHSCIVNPNPIRMKTNCFGYRGIISTFVTIYYKCEVQPERPLEDTYFLNKELTSAHTVPSVGPNTTTRAHGTEPSLRYTSIENNTILLTVIATCGLIVGVLLTLLGECIFYRCCKPTNQTKSHYETRRRMQSEQTGETSQKELEINSLYRTDTYESLGSPTECSLAKQVVDLEPSASLRGLCAGESYINSKL